MTLSYRSEEFLSLRREGLSGSMIGERLGIPVTTAESWLYRAGREGLVERQRFNPRQTKAKWRNPEFLALRQDGLSDKQIAEAMGITVAVASKWGVKAAEEGLVERRYRSGGRTLHVFTQEQDDAIRRMAGDGETIGAIGEAMGFHRSVIQRRMKKLGVQARAKAKQPAAKPKPKPSRAASVNTPPEGAVAIIDLLPSHCRWPYKTDAGWCYCAKPKWNNTSWCEGHAARAHAKEAA